MRGLVWWPLALVLACAEGGDGRGGADVGTVDAGPIDDAGGVSVDVGPREDAEPRDAEPQGAVDARGTDAGMRRLCVSDEGCSDDLACSGEDYCDDDGFCAVRAHAGCDDGIACTVDSCVEPSGSCSFVPDDDACGADMLCDPAEGCVEPPPCTDDATCDDGVFCNGAETCHRDVGCRSGTPPACDDGEACTADSFDPATDACAHRGTDADMDGFVAVGCLDGTDCDDGDRDVNPDATEICNGVDDDCRAGPDDGFGCVLGAAPASCTTSCGTAGTETCDASCALDACVAADETCFNGCDDDGDTRIDEGAACAVPPPANDECAGAIVVSGAASGTRMDTLAGATAQVTGCGTGVEVFYSVNASVRSLVYMDTVDTALDTRISYLGTSCPGTVSQCEDDACGGSGAQLARVIEPGTHFFAVHTATSTVAPGEVAIRYVVTPAGGGTNVEVTTSGTHAGSTSGGSNRVDASCGSSGAPEDAYWWTQCPGETRSITADTCDFSTTFDTKMHFLGERRRDRLQRRRLLVQ